MAQIKQVCVGRRQEVKHEGESLMTGIFKQPTDERVEVGLLSLAGDDQVDLRYHGGRDKAIYVYPEIQFEYWQKNYDRELLGPSFFGENLVVDEYSDETVNIGDRFQLGTAQVIVAQPRIPCFKLGIRVDDSSFPAQFLNAGWLGFYLRVEEPGHVQCGDKMEMIAQDENKISVRDLWKMTFTATTQAKLAQRALDVLPYIDEGWKKRLRRKASV